MRHQRSSTTSEKNQITQRQPNPTVPGFLIFGPAITLDVGATVSVEELGVFAFGYELNVSEITAHFDISRLWATYCRHITQH